MMPFVIGSPVWVDTEGLKLHCPVKKKSQLDKIKPKRHSNIRVMKLPQRAKEL